MSFLCYFITSPRTSKLVLLSLGCLSGWRWRNQSLFYCCRCVNFRWSVDGCKTFFFFFLPQVKERSKFQVFLNTQGYRVCGQRLRMQGRRMAWQRQIGADSCDIIFSQYETESNVQYFHFDSILSLIFGGFVFFRFKILKKARKFNKRSFAVFLSKRMVNKLDWHTFDPPLCILASLTHT